MNMIGYRPLGQLSTRPCLRSWIGASSLAVWFSFPFGWLGSSMPTVFGGTVTEIKVQSTIAWLSVMHSVGKIGVQPGDLQAKPNYDRLGLP